MQWKDFPAIEQYQNYIDYLEEIVYNLKRELGEAQARLDPPSSEDDGRMTGPMVFKTNTGCVKMSIAPALAKRRTLHQQLHPHHLYLHLHPCLGMSDTCSPSTPADPCSLGTSLTSKLVSNVAIIF
jgi:hypothetical protein